MASKPPSLSGLAPLRMSTASTAMVTPELRAEIAQRLLGGDSRDDVARWLSIKGLPVQTIHEELDIAVSDPFYRGTMRLQQRHLKQDWLLAIHRRLAELDPARQSVPVENAIAPEDFLTRYYAANRPALLKGLVDDWPALAKWDLDYIEDAVDEGEVAVQWGREASPDYERNKAAFKRIMPFAAVLERLRSGEPSNDFYITASNDDENDRLLAALWSDVGEMPGILEGRDERDGFFWMGPQGTITPFHHDLTNNLIVQIAGEKRVKLVAPHDTPLMRNDRHCFSQWSGEDLPEGAPTRRKPRVLEVTMGPGDALFVPVGWWHHVEALSLTIGMSFTNFVWPNDHADDYRAFGEM